LYLKRVIHDTGTKECPNRIEGIEIRAEKLAFLRVTKFTQQCRTSNNGIHDSMTEEDAGENEHGNWVKLVTGVDGLCWLTVHSETLQECANYHDNRAKYNRPSASNPV
jgi:hypothetical protein